MSISLRDIVLRISPPWLAGGADPTDHVGARLLYSIVVQLDAFGDRLVEGMRASEPEYAAVHFPEALPFIGRDRGILYGLAETPEAYAARSLRWLDDWVAAGNAFAVMQQIRGYLSGHEVKLRVINNTGGKWCTVNADGSREYLRADPTNWNWSDEPGKVSRNWLIIYVPASLWEEGPLIGEDTGLWDDEIGSDGFTIGSTATPNQLADLRAIVDTFKGAHSKYEQIVLAFDPDSFDPEAAPGSPGMPDGTWANHFLLDGVTEARLDTARYVRGYM